MKAGVLVTNGGSHPPEKWAKETASQIADVIQIEPDSIVFDAATAAKDKFQADLEAALVDHHDMVQTTEVDALDEHGADRLGHALAPDEAHVADAVATVQAVAAKSMFASHFLKPEVVQFVTSTIANHFATVKHIERSWHADKNPNTPQAKAFRNFWHG